MAEQRHQIHEAEMEELLQEVTATYHACFSRKEKQKDSQIGPTLTANNSVLKFPMGNSMPNQHKKDDPFRFPRNLVHMYPM